MEHGIRRGDLHPGDAAAALAAVADRGHAQRGLAAAVRPARVALRRARVQLALGRRPAGIGFAGSGLGPQHANDLFVGAARTFLDGGYLFEFKFDSTRQHFAFSDPALADQVDDNDYKFDEGESGSLVAGENFGIVTNIVTGPDGDLYVTSLTNGAVYKISNTNS